MQSRLAAAIAALVMGVISARIPLANVPEQTQGVIAGVLALIGGALFPALKAQFDEQKAQLFGVIGIGVAAGADWLIVSANLSDQIQAVALLVVNGLASLLLPALHLQQATTFHAIPADTRPSERPSTRRDLGDAIG